MARMVVVEAKGMNRGPCLLRGQQVGMLGRFPEF